MNLNAIVSGAVGVINPPMMVAIYPSQGYTTNAAGQRTPAYGDPQQVRAYRNALQYNDLVMTDGLNMQGVRCKLYLDGDWNGVIRADQKGGDLIQFPDGSKWLVAVQAENWGGPEGWTAVICTRQAD